MDCSPNSSSATEHMRSAEFDIRSKNKVDCQSLKRTFKWEVFNKTSPDTPLNLTGRANTSKEFLTVFTRTLAVGLYKVCFTLNMTEVIGVFGTACCYFRIIPSPLIAEIVGGTQIAVGFNKTKILDAADSCDPDTGFKASNTDSKLKCYSFCKRKGDNYTLPTSIDPNSLPPVPKTRILPEHDSQNMTDLGGCFGDGPGRINNNASCAFSVFTGKMLENTTYDFRLCVVHEDRRVKCRDQRWNVKKGDPPSMAIT
jgi:hypothetical protein